jgi:hypothetical protein
MTTARALRARLRGAGSTEAAAPPVSWAQGGQRFREETHERTQRSAQRMAARIHRSESALASRSIFGRARPLQSPSPCRQGARIEGCGLSRGTGIRDARSGNRRAKNRVWVMRDLERSVVGCAPLVHLGDGFVELAPACVPGAFRFWRGKAPSSGVPLHSSPRAGSSSAVEKGVAALGGGSHLHRGADPPHSVPGEPHHTVASAGAREMVGPRSSRPCSRSQGPAPARPPSGDAHAR